MMRAPQLTPLITGLILMLIPISAVTADDVIILEDIPEPTAPEQVEPIIENPVEFDVNEATVDSTDTPVETDVNEVTTESPEITDGSSQPKEENVKVNVVNVSETFFRVTTDPETGSETRTATQEAKPGDLIEIVIAANNASDETLRDVELTNVVPSGPVQLLLDTIDTNFNNGLYRLSRNGSDFFPAEAELDADTVGFIQWVIFSLPAGETATFRYRIQINP
ncbi:hypothetical protein [Reinekea blandensis]|uniref:DUF11 domain-containing protein n=1 Tax=Reinekea blandensis MED297 TaxID=314283 RepID=A4BHD9_9GAMM|nr:hypothetical protein [Reinekea blandensis]EAR08487.1 hypothetical protein MED297_17882 [Reinekea sp. MED297] [Reinekea blandensis MED297]